MSERIETFDLIERLDAASRDETLSDGMLYRAAAERLAEYISRDVKYWHSIMQRTDKQADRIAELEERLEWREDGHDGIYCRDETIRLLEAEVERLRGGIRAVLSMTSGAEMADELEALLGEDDDR